MPASVYIECWYRGRSNTNVMHMGSLAYMILLKAMAANLVMAD